MVHVSLPLLAADSLLLLFPPSPAAFSPILLIPDTFFKSPLNTDLPMLHHACIRAMKRLVQRDNLMLRALLLA